MRSKLLKQLKASDTFIGAYMRHQDATETAELYDFWCALWIIGNIIGRNTYVARPRAPVFLNWYIFLVAESGVTRKSSAVREALSWLRPYVPNGVDVIEAKTTPEKLEQTLALQTLHHGTARAIVSVSEAVTLFGKERYNMGMPGLLTDLYDCAAKRQSLGTLAYGALTMQEVFVSLLTASTPSWLASAINPTVIEGGFTSRCIFAVSEKSKRRVAWPSEKVESSQVADQLAKLHGRRNLIREITLTDEALAAFTKWYNTRRLHDDLYRTSFESREDAHVLRVAACLTLNEGYHTVPQSHIQIAIEVIEDAKERGYGLFALTQSSDNRLVAGVEALRTTLIAAGNAGINGTDLSIRMARHFKRLELQTALRIMHELALVQRFQLRSDGAGRPKTIWRATKAIVAEDALNSVKERLERE